MRNPATRHYASSVLLAAAALTAAFVLPPHTAASCGDGSLVPDCGFEDPTLSHWQLGAGSDMRQNTAVVRSGNGSVEASSSFGYPNNIVIVSECFPVEAGRSYSYGGYFRLLAGTPPLCGLNISNCDASCENCTFAGSTGLKLVTGVAWKAVEFEQTITENSHRSATLVCTDEYTSYTVVADDIFYTPFDSEIFSDGFETGDVGGWS